MWILPPSITSAFAQDTEESISVSPEQWATDCERSLIARSKPSPARTWSQRWKRDSWTRHLFGLISSPSHGKSFVDWWTSSVAATRASRLVLQASAPVKTTLATFGRGSQMELPFADHDSASLKTLKDTLPLGSVTSSRTWAEWVTERRGAYSQRLKSALHTNENGSSSWPSVVASEVRQGFQDRSRGKKGSQESLTTVVMKHGPPAQANPSTDGSRREFWVDWRTPQANEAGARVETLYTKDGQPARPGERAYRKTPDGRLVLQSQTINQQVEMVQNWLTPRANEPNSDKGFVARNGDRGEHCHGSLSSQAKTANQGKLNPRWVETLMGVPIGWTMPSCTLPVTIAPTNCDSSETESCQPQQSERF
jgi:hypothetical protein